jgi:hypothetical protein
VHTPVRRAERVSPSHHLTSDHHDHQTRVAVPPSVVNRHRHGGHEADEQVPHHALPLFGTNGVPKQPTTNVLESAVDGQTTANGKQSLETKGKHRAENNGNQPAETTYQQPAETVGQPPTDTNGKHPAETNGQHPAKTNGKRPVEERPLPPCERWRCLSTSPYECASQMTCLRTRPVEPIVQADTDSEQPAQTNGQSPVETNGEQPVETNGQHPAETNGHKPVKTPPVAPSSEDDRVNEPRWIARWPTSDATFPVDAQNGMS